jgi:hypothetical protein
MSCKYCEKPIKKGDKFILVGIYPSYWGKEVSKWGLLKPIGPDKFGEIYHEACYSLQNQESKRKEGVKP